MTARRIILRHLTFVGPNAKPSGLGFEDGLNILYGASNTGKSFTLKALDFAMGAGKKLPGIEQRQPYDTVLLGLTYDGDRDITLVRGTKGGGFLCYPGLHEFRPTGLEPTKLAERKKGKNNESLSHFLLAAVGLTGQQVVKNSNGDKEAFSFRHLAPYLFVEEDDIMAERSPILSGQFTLSTLEKNVFKLLLTGRDDSAVISEPSKKTAKAARQGKADLIAEMLHELDLQIGKVGFDEQELEEQQNKLRSAVATVQDTVQARQKEVDDLIARRRDISDRLFSVSGRLAELELTLERFRKLHDVYNSDLGRLEALEEGGGLLMTRLGRTCPVCGAPPEYQKHTHGSDEIQLAHRAAIAEVRKIERERRDLLVTVNSLEAEAEGLRRGLTELAADKKDIEDQIENVRPSEAQGRNDYEALLKKQAEVHRVVGLFHRRDELETRKRLIEQPATKGKSSTLEQGIDGATADAFALKVQQVLEAWCFPGSPRVSFDLELQDIRVNGKERSANGKGVRALLHAAFKVAVLLFCRERGLPHPGFVVLDTPLLTYREPLTSRHGELSSDEKVIAASPLNESFYHHLSGLRGEAQFVVIENADPPQFASTEAKISVFTGGVSVGRMGFF